MDDDVPALQRALREATTDCLTSEQRQTYLGESEGEARDASEAAAESTAALLATELGMTEAERDAQVAAYRASIAAERAAGDS